MRGNQLARVDCGTLTIPKTSLHHPDVSKAPIKARRPMKQNRTNQKRSPIQTCGHVEIAEE